MPINRNRHINVRAVPIIAQAFAEHLPAYRRGADSHCTRLIGGSKTAIRSILGKVEADRKVPWDVLCQRVAKIRSLLSEVYEPEDARIVLRIIDNATRQIEEALETEDPEPPEEYAPTQTPGDFIYVSEKMARTIDLADRVASEVIPVLISGETGVGKELVAQRIHTKSGSPGRFVEINCAAMPESLLESELFGHVKGAFTDAQKEKIGLCEAVGRGTLFLDEIGEMPIGLQAKLLRILDTHHFRKVGGLKTQLFRGRIVAATNTDLKQAIEEGSFRKDLYFRLAAFPIEVPPLRERHEDIDVLIDFFLKKLNHGVEISDDALAKLQKYAFPGNVRELMWIITRAYILAKPNNQIRNEHILLEEQNSKVALEVTSTDALLKGIGMKAILDTTEWHLIDFALSRSGGNVQQAANILRINRSTLAMKLRTRRPK